MKKLVPLLAVVVLIATAVAAYILIRKDSVLVANSDTKTVASSEESTDKSKTPSACDLLTQADADALLGVGSKKGETTVDASTGDVEVSNCTYTLTTPLKSASVVARTSKSKAGAGANKKQFTMELPGAPEKVSGVGDAAYWDPTLGQLNILKDNNWYIVSIGGLRPTDKTLAEAKAFATRITSRL